MISSTASYAAVAMELLRASAGSLCASPNSWEIRFRRRHNTKFESRPDRTAAATTKRGQRGTAVADENPPRGGRGRGGAPGRRQLGGPAVFLRDRRRDDCSSLPPVIPTTASCCRSHRRAPRRFSVGVDTRGATLWYKGRSSRLRVHEVVAAGNRQQPQRQRVVRKCLNDDPPPPSLASSLNSSFSLNIYHSGLPPLRCS